MAEQLDTYIYQTPKSDDNFSISKQDTEVFRALPYHAREEIRENVHKYIEQMGRDYLPQKAVG